MSMTREKALETIAVVLQHTETDCDYAYDNTDGSVDLLPGQDIADALRLALAALREQEERRWIPVTERLPEDDLPKNTKKKMIRCLVYTDKGTIKPCVRQRWEHFDGQLVPWQWNKDLYTKPTHWMYYPQPPKGE